MGEWKKYKIGELADVGSSKRIFYKEYVPNGIPFYRSKEIIEKKEGKEIIDGLFIKEERYLEIKEKHGAPSEGDLLLSSVGHRSGIPYVVKDEGDFYFKDGNLIWLRKFNKKLNSTFLYYWINSCIGQNALESIMIGSAQKALTISGIKFLDINIPEQEEQRAIASVLSSLDDKIDLLHRQNKTLEAMAETLFRQWFVQPIIQAERDGSKAVGFQSGKLDKWIETTLGGDWGKENPTGDFVVPVYCIRGTDIADLNTGIPRKTPVRHVKKKKFENIEPKEGDIIIEISGGAENQSTGRTTYINGDIKSLFQLPLVFSNFCRLLKIKKEEYSFFVYSYLQYLYKQDEFFNLENGSSGIKNLDYNALLFELDYPMPQESMVVEFDEEVKDYFKKINQNKSQIRTLEKLRDTLLPKLMSCEVRVSY